MNIPIMQPAKNKAWTSPTLYFCPHINPNSDTVEFPIPPNHSQDPGSSSHTLLAVEPHPRLVVHRQPGSRSEKIITMVWIPSRAQAMLVSKKCLNCHHPNSPQYFSNIWSIVTFFGFEYSSTAEGMSGDRRSPPSCWFVDKADDFDIFCWWFFSFLARDYRWGWRLYIGYSSVPELVVGNNKNRSPLFL